MIRCVLKLIDVLTTAAKWWGDQLRNAKTCCGGPFHVPEDKIQKFEQELLKRLETVFESDATGMMLWYPGCSSDDDLLYAAREADVSLIPLPHGIKMELTRTSIRVTVPFDPPNQELPIIST